MTAPAKRAGGDAAARTAPRVLVVVQFLPYPPQQGFALRVHYLVRELARQCRVTIVAYDVPGHEGAAEVYREAGIEVVLVPFVKTRRSRVARKLRALVSSHSHRWHDRYRREMQATLDRILGERRHDVVQIESPEFWRYQYATEAPVVLDAHNIWYELRDRAIGLRPGLARQLWQRWDNAKARREEHAAWRRLDGVLVTSEREAHVVRTHRGKDGGVQVVPNGVDPFYFAAAGRPTDGDELVFTGLMAYRPNADAVRWFVREILPAIRIARPAAHLSIVGKDVPWDVTALAGPAVTVTGAVPDIRPFLASATLAIVPLRAGSGTRIKILEALATGRPVVTTRIGAEGLDVVDGEHVLLADDAASFAAAVVRLLVDRDEAGRLGAAGRRLVEERYAWSAIAAELAEHYRSLVTDATRDHAPPLP